MSNRSWNRSTPLGVRLLCVLMSGLTACSTARPQHVWHELPSQQGDSGKQTQIMSSWGERQEERNVIDSEVTPGFLLTMRSLADNKLNGDYRVEFNGDIQMPYDITVNTAGMTLSQLKKKLDEVYRPYFKTPSDIEVRVKEQRYWVDVRGLVQKPGRYLIEPEASLDSVIGLAGGTSKDPAPLYVRIQKGQKLFIFDLDQYYAQGEDHPQILGWLGGEVLFFQKERSGVMGEQASYSSSRTPVYWMGEVRKPGEYSLSPGSDILDSLTQAGGFTEKADLDDIQIIRRTGGRKRVYNFSWNDFQHAPSPLQGDVLYVHADNTTKFERHATLFATLIAAVGSVVTTVVLVLAYNKGRI